MDARYAAIYPSLYRNHWWWRVRERMLVETLHELVATPPVRILDVGCGGGLFFNTLQQFGDVTGIEADASSVEASNPWKDRIICGELDESYLPSAPFDLILMFDVLEHVSNAGQLLRNAARILAQGGRIVVTVPAFQWLWTEHDDMNHHVKRYTAQDLRSVLSQSGLVVFETRYLFQSLILPKLAVRMTEVFRSRRPDVPTIPGRLLSAALQKWFWTEHKVLGRLPFGTSVLAIAGVNRPVH
jgi:2-polyprenyl-3-methyl-5-hydroxy-6-metoxy-1,4-benzoquinol methylase